MESVRVLDGVNGGVVNGTTVISPIESAMKIKPLPVTAGARRTHNCMLDQHATGDSTGTRAPGAQVPSPPLAPPRGDVPSQAGTRCRMVRGLSRGLIDPPSYTTGG